MVEKVWADLGPTLAESARNPNDNCFTLVVTADDYDAVAARLAALEGDYSMVLKNLAWHVVRLAKFEAALRGIASCSTCEVCRNVAINILEAK